MGSEPRKKKQTGISDEYSNVSFIIENSVADASNTSEECYDAAVEFKEKYDVAELAQISSPAQDVAHFHCRAEYEDLSEDISQYIEYEGPSSQPTGHYVHHGSIWISSSSTSTCLLSRTMPELLFRQSRVFHKM